MSTIAEVFPPDDPVARFMITTSMARNDIRHALFQAGKANERGDEELLNYWVRLSTGHFFEAAYALRHWRQEFPQVRTFIGKLPKPARAELRAVMSSIQRMGSGVLEHTRDRTFHYPYPASKYQTDAELTDTLKALGEMEAGMVVEGDGRFRLQFADRVALALALRKHDVGKLDQQLKLARDGAIAFVNFATSAWEVYLKSRGLTLGDPQPQRS